MFNFKKEVGDMVIVNSEPFFVKRKGVIIGKEKESLDVLVELDGEDQHWFKQKEVSFLYGTKAVIVEFLIDYYK